MFFLCIKQTTFGGDMTGPPPAILGKFRSQLTAKRSLQGVWDEGHKFIVQLEVRLTETTSELHLVTPFLFTVPLGQPSTVSDWKKLPGGWQFMEALNLPMDMGTFPTDYHHMVTDKALTIDPKFFEAIAERGLPLIQKNDDILQKAQQMFGPMAVQHIKKLTVAEFADAFGSQFGIFDRYDGVDVNIMMMVGGVAALLLLLYIMM